MTAISTAQSTTQNPARSPAQNTAPTVYERLGSISRALCWLAGLVLLLGMGVATCVDIVVRMGGAGIPGIWEAVTLAMRAMIGLALPYAFYSGSHVCVEMFTDALPARLRQGAIVLALLLSTLLMALLAWKITARLLDIRSYGGITADLGLPAWMHWLPLALGPWLSLPVLLALFWREAAGWLALPPQSLAAHRHESGAGVP